MAKIKGDLNAILRKALEKEVGRIKLASYAAVPVYGESIVADIKKVVASGNSPIEGKGRYPAYKAVQASKTLGALARSASGRKDKGRAASLRLLAKESKKTGYPYSVQGDFPDKRPRPVNLFLSGEQLKDLQFRRIAIPNTPAIQVGYFDELSQKKELGHREGANGQPRRPTIPVGTERFSVRIMTRALQAFEKALAKALKRA